MQTFQSKMADNQSQQPAKSAKNTDLHISASTGIYLFSLFGSKLPHNRDAQSPQHHGRGCFHAHDGLGAQWCRGQHSCPQSKKVCSLPRGVCPVFPLNIHY